jgi:putative acetyltransferase
VGDLSSPIEIRPEQSGDAEGIAAVHRASFPTDDEARLVDTLRSAGRLSVSLVALTDGEVVGHVAFSPVTAGAEVGAGLAPLAVLPGLRRRGIAAALVREGLAACRNLGFRWVVVLGEPEYYSRFGFTAASRFGLSDDYGGGEAFQALELEPDALAAVSGRVSYAPEFATLSA